jgi:hypothetical protein
MMDIGELLFSRMRPVVKAPDWLKGMAICPMMIGKHLWWDVAPIMMVRGAAPSGVALDHTDLHILPADFGPKGRPKQVIPDTKDVNGILLFRDQLGEVSARCVFAHFKLASQMAESRSFWFVYPPDDPDTDQKEPLVGVCRHQEANERGEMIETFEPFAFVSQAVISMHNFLSQEEIDRLPIFRGTRSREGSDE